MLELQQVTFGFSLKKQVLKGVSLSLLPGHIYALVGSNGAGKTTLFNLITGFIKPSTGEIYFNQKSLLRLQPHQINNLGITRSFQDLRFITKLTVLENVILSMKANPTDSLLKAMLPQRFYRTQIQDLEKNANNILHEFFLEEVRHSLAGEISYGQQKLLSLACCVSNSATLLLLDEPIAGIQPEYRKKIAILIKRLKQQGKTILLIEHNTDFIGDVAERILFLHDGEIKFFANIEALKKDQQVIEAYI